MDATGVRTVVNLDGGWDQRLEETLAALDNAHPGRFLSVRPDQLRRIDEPGWTDRELKRLEAGFRAGAKGLKIHKNLGLGASSTRMGTCVAVDDPKIDPLWELCGKYKRPVVDPHGAIRERSSLRWISKNERWHELNDHPNWLFHGKDFPPRAELHAQRCA